MKRTPTGEPCEFAIGDRVTFKPYEKECKCIVRGVKAEPDRIVYELDGEAISFTTGRSIMESVLFDPWTEEMAANFFKT
jgi:hypothetical protein